MKHGHALLRASIIAALTTVPTLVCATTSSLSVSNALAGIDTSEAPRITQTINLQAVSTLQHTHLSLLAQRTPTSAVASSIHMQHLQLILQPSAKRTAALHDLVSQQHDPSSTRFHQWLTPAQYGQAFGVADSDIAAVTSWLVSQGFTVNAVYPNKTQIDFSGTSGQVQQALHTQLALYTIHGKQHLANTSDISVPTALKPVIAGVMGLNHLGTQSAASLPPKVGTWDASTHAFSPRDSKSGNSMAVPFQNGGLNIRGLVPNDFANMYGVMPIRRNGVTGKGITIAVVEDNAMAPADWTNFVNQFNLASYGGTFSQIQPNLGDTANCIDPNAVFNFYGFGSGGEDSAGTALAAEYATAIAPGANIEVAACFDTDVNFNNVTSNYFGGTFVAATNLINAPSSRPDIISASYTTGELDVDSASKMAIDLMWAQADAEGISVFVSTGNAGTNPNYTGVVIQNEGIDASALATSPNVTAVGGTDIADVLDGTTSQYFNSTLNVAYGSAKGYVPEIPWNASCGNGVAAKAKGFSSAVAFCQKWLENDPNGYYLSSTAASGGPSLVDAKPTWQRLVTGAATDQSRDIPDVALFAGSYNDASAAIICTRDYPCEPNFTTTVQLEEDTSLSAPMMAGIQALIDQGIAMRGLPADQGNAAPTLYALAGQEYGTGVGTPPASLATCNSDNGENGTSGCVFHNITRGSISTQCVDYSGLLSYEQPTPNCYFYGTFAYSNGNGTSGNVPVGLTSTDTSSYGPTVKAYSAQPGWSFASGLGSVDARNLLIAWRAFLHAPAAPPAS